MLDRFIRLALMVRIHTLFKLFERFLRELPIVFGGFGQVGVAASVPAWQWVFRCGGARREGGLDQVHGGLWWVYDGNHALRGVSGVSVHDFVFVGDEVKETE